MNSVASLGTVVRTYAPPNRWRSLAWVLALGALAAVTWWLGSVLEGWIWAVPFLLAAVVLSLRAFTFVLRLLGPGRRVVVHQHGIRVGRRTHRWDELERVEYSREASQTDEGAVDHQWRFARHDGTVDHLAARDDGLGFYLDVAELEALLADHVEGYENLNAPKVATDADPSSPLAESELPERAEVAARLGERTEWSDVVELLRHGEERRGRLGKAFRARAAATSLGVLALKGVTWALTFGAFLAALVLVLRGGEALFADEPTLDAILEALGLRDDLVGYAVLGLGAVLGFSAATRLEDRFRALHPRSRRYRAVADRLRETGAGAVETLDGHVRAGRPFGIYLRSFAGEHFRFVETSPVLAELPDIEPVARELDTRVAALVSENMPLFALANVADPTPPADVTQLFVADEAWEPAATELLRRADLVVLHLSRPTPSLLRELVVLDQLEARDRTLLLLGDNAAARPDLEALVERFPHRSPARPDEIEKSLAGLTAWG